SLPLFQERARQHTLRQWKPCPLSRACGHAARRLRFHPASARNTIFHWSCHMRPVCLVFVRSGRWAGDAFEIAWPARSRNRRRTMSRGFLRRQIASFEHEWNYDAAYLYDLNDADPHAMLTFGKVQYLTKYRKDIPVAAYFAAGLIAVMAED